MLPARNPAFSRLPLRHGQTHPVSAQRRPFSSIRGRGWPSTVLFWRLPRMGWQDRLCLPVYSSCSSVRVFGLVICASLIRPLEDLARKLTILPTRDPPRPGSTSPHSSRSGRSGAFFHYRLTEVSCHEETRALVRPPTLNR